MLSKMFQADRNRLPSVCSRSAIAEYSECIKGDCTSYYAHINSSTPLVTCTFSCSNRVSDEIPATWVSCGLHSMEVVLSQSIPWQVAPRPQEDLSVSCVLRRSSLPELSLTANTATLLRQADVISSVSSSAVTQVLSNTADLDSPCCSQGNARKELRVLSELEDCSLQQLSSDLAAMTLAYIQQYATS